jgi:hypothetical protein
MGRPRSLILAVAVLSACRGIDSKSHDFDSDRTATSSAAQAAMSGGVPGGGDRFAVHASRIGGSGRRTPAALIGTPPPIPASTQFDITGFLEEAHTTGPHTAGSLTVNGHVVTIPANTIVILPASALTWDELFTQAPAPYGPAQTGLAMFDTPAPLTTSEVHVIGNRVTMAPGGDQYIAGLVYLSQQSVNAGAGFINFIDYDAGELRVGGTPGDRTTGTRVRINDPVVGDLGTGRYSKGLTPDRRFTVDQDNPTIMSATGFPMCLPRVAPPAPQAAETDPLCPQGNRPLDQAGQFIIKVTMPDPATLAPGQLPDPRVQAPLEVGDYINFSGILVTDNANPTTGPWPGIANTYISAYTIVNNTAIYTAAGKDPAYVEIEVTLMGTGGLTAVGVGEAAARTRFEGMTTDPTRGIHLYGIDLDPATGATTDRDFGTIAPDQVAVPGRWRFRPPCDPFGTIEPPATAAKNCVMNQAGSFLPPTREVRAVIEGQQGQVPSLPGAQTAANGLFFGQYHAPILEYIFPENIPGSPIVPDNFGAIPFLACGGFTSSAGTLAGPLDPFPRYDRADLCERGEPAGGQRRGRPGRGGRSARDPRGQRHRDGPAGVRVGPDGGPGRHALRSEHRGAQLRRAAGDLADPADVRAHGDQRRGILDGDGGRHRERGRGPDRRSHRGANGWLGDPGLDDRHMHGSGRPVVQLRMDADRRHAGGPRSESERGGDRELHGRVAGGRATGHAAVRDRRHEHQRGELGGRRHHGHRDSARRCRRDHQRGVPGRQATLDPDGHVVGRQPDRQPDAATVRDGGRDDL